MLIAPLAGAVRLAAAGAPANTDSVTSVECTIALGLEVPVTVMVELPVATPAVPTVIVEVPGGVTGLAEKPTVEPAGLPVAASVTGSVKPENCRTLTV